MPFITSCTRPPAGQCGTHPVRAIARGRALRLPTNRKLDPGNREALPYARA